MTAINETNRENFGLGHDAVKPLGGGFALGDINHSLGCIHFERTHWGSFRTTSVQNLMTLSRDRPFQVIVFEDPKLAGSDSEMVMLKKALFENIYGNLKRLMSGQIAISTDLQELTKMMANFQDLIDEEVSTKVLRQTFEITLTHQRSISTVLVPNPHLKTPEPTELSAEDLAWANSIEDDGEHERKGGKSAIR